MSGSLILVTIAALASGTVRCTADTDVPCGPSRSIVARAIDGDTIELATGERVRYLLIDAPELGADECFADEAAALNGELVNGVEVELRYDQRCEDDFGRLLAFVSIDGREINALLVERGYACTLYIPPNGSDRRAEYEALEAAAKDEQRGMWNPGLCREVACD